MAEVSEISAQTALVDDVNAMITRAREVYPSISVGKISDGYHTIDELYHHRGVLFAVIVHAYEGNNICWKSKQHDDGSMYDGMFIVGIDTPEGQATYHYDIEPYWDMMHCIELEKAPKWDGHTPQQAIERIKSLIKAH